MGFYDYKVADTKGGEKDLKDFEGKVVLVVNTATGCGFTPQYKELEEMYEAFHDKGLEILDIPCNQFAGQTPGTDEEIHEFCTLNYNTQFPLYRFLKEQQGFKGFGEGKMADLLRDMLPKIDPDYEKNPEIKWNFTKFLVDRKGNVIARFEPTADMAEVRKAVEAAL